MSEESERLGVMVMHEALKRPIRAVIENKTGETCGHILEKIEREGNFFAGYDVKNCNRTICYLSFTRTSMRYGRVRCSRQLQCCQINTLRLSISSRDANYNRMSGRQR